MRLRAIMFWALVIGAGWFVYRHDMRGAVIGGIIALAIPVFG